MYWTKSKGTGGAVLSEEDFVVEEIPSRKFFIKYSRSQSGVRVVEGPYALAILRKRGITTKDAIKFIRRNFNLKKDEIGYAGLKDKFALTTQYITVKGDIKDIKTDKLELTKIGYTDRMMQVGELVGNKFTISLRNCKNPGNVAVIDEIKKRYMPNYFGPQRFGNHGDNHEVGRLILTGNYEKALDLINKRGCEKSFDEISKKTLKFFIHAYQSFLFNKILDIYISKYSKACFVEFPLVGYDTKLKKDFASQQLKKLMEKDKISPKNFYVRSLNLRCNGSFRRAFVKVSDLSYKIEGSSLVLTFILPKGSYATTLLNEITKGVHRQS
ncbi:MAG TPA: tRNA pseudouridine(13) synthase TruD [archaeon]|nr:tRNA pseudouridine(13) synthase TruD [archaeon]